MCLQGGEDMWDRIRRESFLRNPWKKEEWQRQCRENEKNRNKGWRFYSLTFGVYCVVFLPLFELNI